MRLAWLDCRAGVSGDMLLGALAGVGVLDDLPAVVADLRIGAAVRFEPALRGGISAVRAIVESQPDQPSRRLTDLLELLGTASVADDVRRRSADVLTAIAEAEARVHGIDLEAVELHEVGAVDTVVDVLGVCLGFSRLGVDDVSVSRVGLGGGFVDAAHGRLPVPGPAVLELVRRTHLETFGDGDEERATPTGVALLATLTSSTGDLPAMAVTDIGVGAGGRDPVGSPNVVRLVVGAAVDEPATDGWIVIEANVDDLDPRLWPTALDALLRAGAADAWLTPIVMKKGRPAHTVAALTTAANASAVRTALFSHTSTIGARETAVGKHALDRTSECVTIDDQQIRVKLARLDGRVLSATPEWEDVVRAATELDRPAKDVLADATAAARALV